MGFVLITKKKCKLGRKRGDVKLLDKSTDQKMDLMIGSSGIGGKDSVFVSALAQIQI